ncbi:MAG: carbohydrate kinase family protein, partial [Methanolinea sp.]|nr:carbohydrate kinase family protein [Methanolinea sp.]
GGAANIAAGIARLGEKCTLVSAVGGDFSGGEYDRWMKHLGIVQQFFTVKEAHTPTAFLFNDERGDQVTFFEWGASLIFPLSEAPALPFVHMATADPDFNIRVAQKAAFATFDPGQDLHRYGKEQLQEILSHVDILFANHHEVEGMCRILGIGEDDLLGMVPAAVFTMGSRGSDLHVSGECHHVPAIPVRMVDPTGAGDAYRAGFLAAYHRGIPLLGCCRIGTVTASFAVETVGCQNNLPSWNEMAARYGNYFANLHPDPFGS